MRDAQKPDHVSLNTLIGRMKEGRFVIPDFQREFEWQPWDIRDLIRSIFQLRPLRSISSLIALPSVSIRFVPRRDPAAAAGQTFMEAMRNAREQARLDVSDEDDGKTS